MKRKVSSLVFVLTAISIALGAFGHGSQWPKHVRADVAALAPETIRLLALVWYWVSGTMLVFGLLLLWAWWRMRQGDRSLSRLAGGRFLLRGGHPRRRVWVPKFIGAVSSGWPQILSNLKSLLT